MNKLTDQIQAEVNKVVLGKGDIVRKVLLAILAQGHVLLEDVPGVGKTTLALAFSRAMSLHYSRVQFTPDVLPSDIVGFSMPDKSTGKMLYKPGAILCNLFLADELNRATSRTQSALLEAMEENQVTVDGVSHPLPDPFIVIATQNPTGAAGLADIRRQAANVYIADSICEYIVALVAATRRSDYILRGASPRASLAVASMARATAWIEGRDYVIPEDVTGVFIDCLDHRLLLTPEGEDKRYEVLTNILRTAPRPAIR